MSEQADVRPDYAAEVSIEEVYADLGGVPEVAAALGVSIFRVRRWIERRATTNCPRPVRALTCGHIFSLNEWKGWFALWKVTRGSETWRNRKPKEPACPPDSGRSA